MIRSITNSFLVLIGLTVATLSAANNGSIQITGNIMHRVYRGIQLNGLSGFPSIIKDNTVRLATDNVFNTWQRGIELVNTTGTGSNCCNNIVETNTLSCFPTSTSNTQASLIFGSMNGGPTSPRITCNNLSYSFRGLEFRSFNPGTYLRRNDLENLGRGLELRLGGVIGVQCSSVVPSDNRWLGNNWIVNEYNTFIGDQQTYPALSPLWVKGISPFYPNNNAGIPSPNAYGASNGLSVTPSGTYICGGGPNQIAIAVPKETDYPDHEEMYYIARFTLYRTLFYNQGILEAGSDLKNWFDANGTSTMHSFMQIDSLLNIGDFSTAYGSISDFDPDVLNDPEANQLTFYRLYLQFADVSRGGLTPDDSSALANLCNLCPETDGTAVLQARALYQIVAKDPFFFATDCSDDESGSRVAVRPKNEASAAVDWIIDVFPNPTNGQFTIKSNRNNLNLMAVIKDVSGRTVVSSPLLIRGFESKMQVDLPNGIYIITLFDSSANENRKFVLQK